MRQGPPARQRRSRQRGQGLTEYALTVALVAVMAIVGLGLLKTAVTNAFTGVASSLSHPVVSGSGGGGSGVGSITGQSFIAYTDSNCYFAVTGSDGGVWCVNGTGTNQLQRLDPISRAVGTYPAAPPSGGSWFTMTSSSYDNKIYLVGQGTSSGCKFIVGVLTPSSKAFSSYTTSVSCATYTTSFTQTTANAGGNNFSAAIGGDHNLWVTAFKPGTGGEAFMFNTGTQAISYSTSGATQFWGYIAKADATYMMFVNVAGGACNLYTWNTGTGVATSQGSLTGGACNIGGIAVGGDTKQYVVVGTTMVQVTDSTWAMATTNLLYANNSYPATGPDGNIWLTDGCAVDQVTAAPTPVETNYVVAPSCSLTFNSGYGGLMLGPDSALWDLWATTSTTVPANYIGRIA